jgi:hypothetical protein
LFHFSDKAKAYACLPGKVWLGKADKPSFFFWDWDAILCMWRFNDAYPAKWSVDESNSTNNNILVECIEFAYSFSTREK